MGAWRYLARMAATSIPVQPARPTSTVSRGESPAGGVESALSTVTLKPDPVSASARSEDPGAGNVATTRIGTD